jgi:hypothetical protein
MLHCEEYLMHKKMIIGTSSISSKNINWSWFIIGQPLKLKLLMVDLVSNQQK